MLTHSPSTILFSRIKAELVANGTPFADTTAEAAFRTWFQTAWADSGYTSNFAVLYQPNTSTAFSVGVCVGTAGHKVNVWWGDGTSNSYTPSTSSNTTVSKTYDSAAKRPVVILGRITQWNGPSQAYGGRLWENLRSLTYLECGGCSQIIGSIDNLPNGLTFLSCWGCSQIIGSIDNLPNGLTLLSCWGCPQIIGSIDNLPNGLTFLSCWGCAVTYSAASGSRIWANNMRNIAVNPPSTGIFTSAMTDSLIIDLSAVTTWTDEKAIWLAGNCGAHTSASNAAIATLQGKGVTVTVN